MREIALQTTAREQLLDITEEVRAAVTATGVEVGACLVYCPHTTAGLTINEGFDPAVGHDLQDFLRRLVPEDAVWTHAEGNASAHVRATIVGNAVWIPVENTALRLGRWQAVFLMEFDGPRERHIWLHVVG
jgi:secondary thiamine-phosphate synthase enzyme